MRLLNRFFVCCISLLFCMTSASQVNFFECAKNPSLCKPRPPTVNAEGTRANDVKADDGASKGESTNWADEKAILLRRLKEINSDAAAERDRFIQERRELQSRLEDIERRELSLRFERRNQEEAAGKKVRMIFEQTKRRVALVIGNASYNSAPLRNPVNDAYDMSAALKASGFDVITVKNGSRSLMRSAIRDFGDRLFSSDVGLFYYSGHGLEVKGRNYLIPVDGDILREDEVPDQGVDVNLVLEKMAAADIGINIVILDACRDNPFVRSFRSVSRGLAVMDAPRGTLIAYSTSPGRVAFDGDPKDRNSPYTHHLLRNLRKPNLPIEQIFKEVRKSVFDVTKGTQVPWENTSLRGDFFFSIDQ